LLIDGQLRDAVSGKRYSNESPVTESEICTLPDAGDADVDLTVKAAAKAQELWAQRSLRERAQIVRALGKILRDHREELAALDAIDVGNVHSIMKADVDGAGDTIEMMADMSYMLTGTTYPATTTHLSYSRREPYGVVARIIAFNHPVLFAGQKIAAPLVTGNSLILKPSDGAALSALRMAELLADHVPPGVLNVIVGKGIECPRALVRHPAVKRIGFIGSPQVGMAIQREAAQVSVKHITLELGGKNALLVAPDADLDAAAAGAVKGMNFIGWQSQSCMSTSRALVQRDDMGKFLDRLCGLVDKIKIGDPFAPDTDMGTLASRAQYDKTVRYVEIAKNEGARLAFGGSRPSQPQRGLFYRPTVFADVAPQSRLAQEEVFGPILSVIPYEDLDDAIKIANGVKYGLTGSVWSRDVGLAHSIAHRIQAGYIWVNDSSSYFEAVPFGGYKDSGFGHEDGAEELVSYTQLKAINVRTS
jgi:acyl-CoA reductase-like NAD-dependent aldehyde dehydrogenase